MPSIPEKEDSKEIRLFGEKSIKEEAYRQKIIQLEKEIMRLESMLKSPEKKQEVEQDTKPMGRLPEYSEGLFYEAAVSLDEKVKHHHDMLEKKARDISDRLALQAQNLIEHEKIHRHVNITKKALVILSVFTAAALILGAISVFTIMRLNKTSYQESSPAVAPYESPENIKILLQESGFYNNQYTITTLNYHNKMYKGMVELHFKPPTNWTIKMIASDIIGNFKKFSTNKSMELDFIYEGTTYAKVNFSSILEQTQYKFFK